MSLVIAILISDWLDGVGKTGLCAERRAKAEKEEAKTTSSFILVPLESRCWRRLGQRGKGRTQSHESVGRMTNGSRRIERRSRCGTASSVNLRRHFRASAA